jgi:hypothetical protein
MWIGSRSSGSQSSLIFSLFELTALRPTPVRPPLSAFHFLSMAASVTVEKKKGEELAQRLEQLMNWTPA